MKTARMVVLEALTRLEQDQSYSNLLLDAYLRKNDLSAADRAFATRLFYGVIERKLTLDYLLGGYAKQPLEKMQLPVRIVLWMGFYQLAFMEVPDSAAVNESVKLAGAVKPGAKGFVNALLRQFVRDEKKISWPDPEKDKVRYYSIRYSCPEWLVKQYHNDYGEKRLVQILETSLLPPPVTVRVNPLNTSAEQLMEFLHEEGLAACPSDGLDGCLTVEGNPVGSAAFGQGLFHVQDVASQLCALTACQDNPQTVFDLCAAPGGKSFTIAEKLAGQGTVHSFDLHQNRVKLIQAGAKRLGLANLAASAGDAAVYNESLGTADCVLCDVPCAGLGVIRRKPEIKYKKQDGLEGLPELQRKILQNGSRYVAPGGTLVYSTCSLSKRENEAVAGTFLKENPGFTPKTLPKLPFLAGGEHQCTIFPEQDGPDGFYIATFQRMR